MDHGHAINNEALLKLISYTKRIEEAFLSKTNFKNLSASELNIISKLGEISDATISNLAKAVGVTVSTMTIAANKLLKKGYIAKKRCEQDKRIIYVTLTEMGQEAFDAHEEFRKTVVEKAIGAINEQDVGALSRCVDGLLDYFSTDNTWEL